MKNKKRQNETGRENLKRWSEREREGGRKKDRIKIHVKMMKTAIYVDSSEYFFPDGERNNHENVYSHVYISFKCFCAQCERDDGDEQTTRENAWGSHGLDIKHTTSVVHCSFSPHL